MSFFENSQNTDARGATINGVGRDQVNNLNIGQIINNTINSDTLALLDPVPDAVYDSIRAVSGCLAGTRQEVISEIVKWIDGNSDKPMCWLHGAAGSGKSAISKTIAELCAEKNRLGASFFFLRGAGRRSKITHLIPTLAFHLAFSIPATRPYIESVLHTGHHIVCRSLESQFRKLIIEPIQSAIIPTLPMVVMIDALDECDDKDMIANFINIVAGAVQNPRFRLRFIFTSRVEDHIQKRFSASPALDVTYCLALQNFDAHHDILTFFKSRFSTIYQENRRLMGNVTLPWPSESVLTTLVDKSSGSFIFAFTLANFVNDGSDLPHRKLEAALQSHAGLDPLYTQVLHTAPRSSHFQRIFETIMIVTEHVSVVELAYLFDIETGDVVHALLGVQSIIVVPEDDESPIRMFHTSLRDFLTARARSNEFFINPPIRHISITFDCLATMVIHNGDDFSKHKGLKFACRSWSHHLLCAIQEEGGDNFLFSQYGTFMRKLTDFVSRSFDLWVNSIIAQYLITDTLQTLDSVVLILKTFHRCPPNLLLMIEEIRAFIEFDEKSFCKDNDILYGDEYLEVLDRRRVRVARRYVRRRRDLYDYRQYGGVHDDDLVHIIREWRTSRPATTCRRFQSH